jgi:hypothetical protein
MELPRLKIGLDNYLPVHIKDKDRYNSILVIGKSGTGKSSLLSSFWEQDRFYRNAGILIEPSGFLAADCWSIGKGRGRYCALDSPVSINPMQQPYNPNQVADNIIEAINQVVRQSTEGANNSLTAKMRGLLDTGIKWCLARNRKSLLHVRDYIANLKGDNETRDGIIQRLNLLLCDERLIPIICGNNAIEWGEFIQKGKSLIVDTHGMATDKMVFMGSLVSHGIKSYLRYERPKEYRPLSLVVDECHNFVNSNFLDLLKEGRKFKLSTVLSTQDFAVIDEKMARVMLNVGTIIAFRSGHREAALIAQELCIPAAEIQLLEKYHVAYKTPQATGIAKTVRPPIFKDVKINQVKPRPVKTGGWFDLEPLQPIVIE